MKLKYFICLLVTLLVLPCVTKAASGSISVSSTSTVVVGNKVTVTVKLSSSTKIGSWQMTLNYDKNYLKLTSSSAEAGGTMMAASSSSGITSKTYTFTFTTLKSGSTKVSVSSYLAYAFDDLSEISLSSSSKTIKIITQAELEASYSTDNTLKSLTVDGYEITPEFSSDTLEYSVVVSEDTEEVTINATVNDSTASVTGAGTQSVSLGTNTFSIVVQAQNGDEKTYTLVVEVKDENPITVTVDGVDYTLVKIRTNLPDANYFTEYTVTINDTEIPAYINENSNLILVGLKDSSGNISLFIYDEENNTYTPYYEIGINKITIYPISTDEELDGYTKGTIEIDGVTFNCYHYDESSDFVVIYGMNVETGEEGFYVYDKVNQVVSRYDDGLTTILNEKIKLYTYIIIGFSSILIIMFIILILVLKKKKPKKVKQIKEEPKKDNKTNDIVEVVSDNKEVTNYDEKKKKQNKNFKK